MEVNQLKNIFRHTIMKNLVIILFLAISTVASATSYYISPSGNDSNNGTINAPFFTLNKAWSVIKPGDVIYARGGVYRFNSRQNLTGKSGTSSDTIKIYAYPGEKPVFTKSSSFTTPSFPVSLILIKASYVHLKDLEVAHFTQASSAVWYGIAMQGSNHNKIERLNSHHNGHGMGIRDECSNNLILNSDFHHNIDPLTSYGNADGLAIAYHSSSVENTVRGCRMWNNSDDGLDLWDNNGNLVLENSWAWKNGYKSDGSIAGDGCGFKFGKTTTENGSTFKRTVRNNIAVYNRSRGYMQNSANVRFNFYNNIAWKNNKGVVFSTFNLAHVFRNNIVFDNGENWNGDYSRSVRDHNSNDPSPVASASDFLSVDTMGMNGKRKSNGDLPDLGFMKLASGSDLVDAGVNVGLAFNGNAPDLGPYESNSSAPVAVAENPSENPSETPAVNPVAATDTTSIRSSESISISPSLARNQIAVTNFNPGGEPASLKINDFSGKLLYEAKLTDTAAMQNIAINLTPGYYIAQVTKGAEVFHVQKILIIQ